MHSLKNNHNHKKRTLWNSAKKNFKKNSPKKISKKIEERLPRFSRSKIGEGRGGLYAFVMVVTLLYKRISTEIGTKIGRYGAESRNGKIHPNCLLAYLSGLSGVCWLVGLLWLSGLSGLVGLVWLSGLSGVCWFRFLPLHKKIF